MVWGNIPIFGKWAIYKGGIVSNWGPHLGEVGSTLWLLKGGVLN